MRRSAACCVAARSTFPRPSCAPHFDSTSGREALRLTPHTNSVWGLSSSPNGYWLWTNSRDGTSKLIEAFSGIELMTHRGHAGVSNGGDIAPDCRTAVSCGWDLTVLHWPLSPAKPYSLKDQPDEVWALYERAELFVDTPLTGRVRESDRKANVAAVLDEVNIVAREAALRTLNEIKRAERQAQLAASDGPRPDQTAAPIHFEIAGRPDRR